MNGKILIVDDDPLFSEQVQALLAPEFPQIGREHNSQNVLNLLAREEYAVILLDIQMPPPDGITLLREILKRESAPEIIMVSGAASLQQAADSVRLGAADFIEKPPDVPRLLTSVRNAFERHRLRCENSALRAEYLKKYEIIGSSPIVKELRDTIRQVARAHSNILIWGETGTGKELVASQIHYLSPRAHKNLVKVNCAAIPAELAESELFGHKKGAFTGAWADKSGKFELADKGSLVLDEIAELPLPLQSKLLRILESSELETVGASETRTIDLRLICISGKNLEEEVRAGRFRADLYYRINTIPIQVPALRQRREDIPELFRHFFERLRVDNNQYGRGCDPALFGWLAARDWPGNIRELKNFAERLFFLVRDEIIGPAHAEQLSLKGSASEEFVELESGKNLLTRAVSRFERDFLLINLRQVNGNISELAQILGMDRGNLYRKLKNYRLL